MRFTFPALITSSIKLCRRYKIREHVVGPLYLHPVPHFIFTSLSYSGTRMANESGNNTQIRTPTNLHPRYPSRSAQHRPPAVPPRRTSSRRMRVRRPHLRLLRASIQRLRRQHIRIACSAASYHAHHRDSRRRQSLWRRQLRYSDHQSRVAWSEVVEEESSGDGGGVGESFVVAAVVVAVGRARGCCYGSCCPFSSFTGPCGTTSGGGACFCEVELVGLGLEG